MPNTGYPHVRQAVARHVSEEQAVTVGENDIVMTCGASGALNVALKRLLDPGDEVLTPIPCFVEYGFYADNHGGVLKTVPTHPDFSLDLEGFEQAITDRTKVVYLETIGNPKLTVPDLAGIAPVARQAAIWPHSQGLPWAARPIMTPAAPVWAMTAAARFMERML